MLQTLRDLAAHRELLYMLTWREIKVRYKQSVMGFLWALLMPMIIVAAGVLVRIAMASVNGSKLQAADVAGIAVRALPWAFFVTGVRFATNSLTSNSNLVTKINFPRIVCPLSTVLASLFDLGVALLGLVVLLVVLGTAPSIHWLWAPLLLLCCVVLVSALGIALSAANLFFRDVKYLVEIVLTFAIFFTPVLYEASMLGKWQYLLMFNPMAPILESLDHAVVRAEPPDFGWLIYSAGVSIVALVAATAFFRRAEPRFAESI